MPINNITQTISALPPAGSRGVDVQTQFVIKQEDFQDHLQGITVGELNTLKDQLNLRIGEINSTTTTMNGYANTSSAGASTATTKAGEASTSASDALAYKNQAETFKNNASASATKASQWADNNYNVAVETGKYSAKHWSTVAQNATTGKVDKVASTDNAIVRFNGLTGAVQDSAITIDDSGNVGFGVQPNADTTIPTLFGGYLMTTGYVENYMMTNASYQAGEYKYLTTGRGSGSYYQVDGVHYWTGAAVGTVDEIIDWTQLMRLDISGNLLLTSGTGGIGYGTGAGGTVTQLTSKLNGVTLNKPTGRITMNNEALPAGATVSFGLINNLIEISDIVLVAIAGGFSQTQGYQVWCNVGYKNALEINVKNIHSTTLSESVIIDFKIIKGAIS